MTNVLIVEDEQAVRWLGTALEGDDGVYEAETLNAACWRRLP